MGEGTVVCRVFGCEEKWGIKRAVNSAGKDAIVTIIDFTNDVIADVSIMAKGWISGEI